MTCANCGTPQKDNEEICLACGAKYPEINNINEPTSKSKRKEVGTYSEVFRVFDSAIDATNKSHYEKNSLFDVIKNKKSAKKDSDIKKNIAKNDKETLTEDLVKTEMEISEKNISDKNASNEVIDIPVQKEAELQVEVPIKQEVALQEVLLIQEETTAQEEIAVLEEAQEDIQEEVQEMQMPTNVVAENNEVQIETEQVDLENQISAIDFDNENDIFKDSTDFNVSLNDLEELEKAIEKDKIENFGEATVDFDSNIEVFESFEDAINSSKIENSELDKIEEALNLVEGYSQEIQATQATALDETYKENAENNVEDVAKNILDSDGFTEVEEITDSTINNVDDSLTEQSLNSLDLDVFAKSNNEEIENIDNLDDFIAIDGVEDIMQELDVEEIDDIDEFLANNRTTESLEILDFADIDEFETVNEQRTDIDETVTNVEKSVFDISLDELDDLEKMLIAENENTPISEIEQALLSGKDVVHDFDGAVFNKSDNFIETDEVSEEAVKPINQADKINEAENLEERVFANLSEEKFDKVNRALKLRGKGEAVDFIKENKRDFDGNIDSLNDILSNVRRIKGEIDSYTDEFNEDLLSFEESMLQEKKELEKHQKLENAEHIDDIDGVDFIDFVSADDITGDENLLKVKKEETAQSAVDEMIQQAKLTSLNDTESLEAKTTEEILSSDEQTEVLEENVLGEEAIDGNVSENNDGIVVDNTNENSETKLDGIEIENIDIEDIEKELEQSVVTDIEDVENEILAKLTNVKVEDEPSVVENEPTSDIDSLILDVIGDFPKVKEKQENVIKEKPVFQPEEGEVTEYVETLEAVQGFKYDEELVREYETLRMDLELLFPNTQELDKLERDISKLLANSQVDELATQIEHDLLLGDLGDFDFEELNDKEISDALLEIREMKEKEDNAKRRRDERQKRFKRNRKRFVKFYTYGGLFKKIDATIVHCVVITLIIVGYAGYSTYKTQNFSVNMLSRSEKAVIAEQLWDGIYDNAKNFIKLQETMQGYVSGDVSQDQAILALNNYIDENIVAREKFEAVDMPTYSEYKYKIDKFLADRMLVSEAVLKDVSAGKHNSDSIQELLKMHTDMNNIEKQRDDFYKQMGISFK